MTEFVPSPELLEAARQAIARKDEHDRMLAAMSPEERAAHTKKWAHDLAQQMVEIGEKGVGCACCDPLAKEKLKMEEPKPKTSNIPGDPRVADYVIKCPCGTLLYADRKKPAFHAIGCPVCKLTVKIDK